MIGNYVRKHCPTCPCSEFLGPNCIVNFVANSVGFITAKQKEIGFVILRNQLFNDIWCNMNKMVFPTVILWIVVEIDSTASAEKKGYFLLSYLMNLIFSDYLIQFDLYDFPPKPIRNVTNE